MSLGFSAASAHVRNRFAASASWSPYAAFTLTMLPFGAGTVPPMLTCAPVRRASSITAARIRFAAAGSVVCAVTV